MRRFTQILDWAFKDRSLVRVPKWLRWFTALTFCIFAFNLYASARPEHRTIFSIFTGDRIASAIGSLAGTLIGAWLAFAFAARSRTLVRNDEEVAAGNVALHTLTALFNITWQYRVEISGPFRSRPDAWFNLTASPPIDESYTFDRNSLGFLAAQEPLAYQAIMLEETRFRMFAYAVKHHHELITEKTWPLLVGKLDMGASLPEDELKEVLGPGLVRQLEVTANGIIKNVDENAQSLPAAFINLRQALKRLHPRRKFINFAFADDLPGSQNAAET